MFLARARGLLDFLLAALCLWAAWHHTPAGALVRRGAAWAFGVHSTARPLLAYYDGVSWHRTCPRPRSRPWTPPARPLTDGGGARVGHAPRAEGLDARARAPALALAAGAGGAVRGRCWTRPGARQPLASCSTALAEGFPEEESRLTALFAGRVPARYALERVAAEGGTPTLERLARQLPPGFEDATAAAAQALALSTAFGLAWPVSGAARG